MKADSSTYQRDAKTFGGSSGSIEQWGTEESGYPSISRPCTQLPLYNPQYLIATESYDAKSNDTFSDLHKSVRANLYSAHAWLSKVEVVDDGINRKVSLLPEPEANRSFDIDPFGLLLSSFTINRIEDIDRGRRFGAKFESSHDELSHSYSFGELLQDASKNYTPMIALKLLRRDKKVQAYGTETGNKATLQANLGVCLSMALVSGTCALFVFVSIPKARMNSIHYSRDLATMLGSIVYFCGGPEQPTGATPRQAKHQDGVRLAHSGAWNRATNMSLLLRYRSRILFILLVLTLSPGSLYPSQDHIKVRVS